MSIVTLKKKTLAKYNNMSVDQNGFSLNGTRRSSGYVGQDTLGRSLIRSLAGKNGALKGYGGGCGEYPTTYIKTSPEMIGLNDSTVVKSSSVNNTGHIMSKYRWARRPEPFATWKPGSYPRSGDQSAYISHLAKKTIAESCHDASGNTTPIKCCNFPENSRMFSRNKVQPITKPASFLSAVSSSEHIQTSAKRCAKHDVFFIQKNTRNTAFACGLKNKIIA